MSGLELWRALKLPGAIERDTAMARARMEFDWPRQFSLALDGETARKRYEQTLCGKRRKRDHCSMCGRDFCAVRTTNKLKDGLSGKAALQKRSPGVK
jgi:phosphomethylpyrimidine synthase